MDPRMTSLDQSLFHVAENWRALPLQEHGRDKTPSLGSEMHPERHHNMGRIPCRRLRHHAQGATRGSPGERVLSMCQCCSVASQFPLCRPISSILRRKGRDIPMSRPRHPRPGHLNLGWLSDRATNRCGIDRLNRRCITDLSRAVIDSARSLT